MIHKKTKKEKERKGRERKSCRERLHLLSKFPGDQTDGFKRSKKKSSFSRQGLRIETGIGEFRQTPRGWVFSSTWFNHCLRVIQMAWVVQGREWQCEPSQDFETVCWKFRNCFQTVRGLSFGLSKCPCINRCYG